MHKIFQLIGRLPNKSLHLTAIPLPPFDNLRTFSSIAAGELGRWPEYLFMKNLIHKTIFLIISALIMGITFSTLVIAQNSSDQKQIEKGMGVRPTHYTHLKNHVNFGINHN